MTGHERSRQVRGSDLGEVWPGTTNTVLKKIKMVEAPAYGFWPVVIINAAVFIILAFSFTRPRTTRDWRSFSAFSAFIVALFTEIKGGKV